MMPCLPAYGGYDHHWLKAVRRQQNAFTALIIPVPVVSAAVELSGGSDDVLQPSEGKAEAASTQSASIEGSFLAQALSIAQCGLSATVSDRSVLLSMPHCKAEKEVNKQALANVKAMLDPANVKLEPSTPKQHQQVPQQPSTSPKDHAHPCSNSSKPLLPVSLDQETRQQLICFCSTGSVISSCSSQQPTTEVPAVGPAEKPVQVHGRYHADFYGSQSCLLLEEQALDDTAAGLEDTQHTAAAESIGNPAASSKQALEMNGCSMLLPPGGIGQLWMELPRECLAPGACDALYTKVEPLHVHNKHNIDLQVTTTISTDITAETAGACPNLDSILSSWFRNPCSKQQHHLHTKTPAPQIAATGGTAAATAVPSPVCLQQGDAAVGEAAAAAAADQVALVAADSTHSGLPNNSSRWAPVLECSQSHKPLLLDEPVLETTYIPEHQHQQQRLSEQQIPVQPGVTIDNASVEISNSSKSARRQQDLISIQELLQLATTVVPANDMNCRPCSVEIIKAALSTAAAGLAAASAAVTGNGSASAQQTAETAVAAGVSSKAKPWETYVAVDMACGPVSKLGAASAGLAAVSSSGQAMQEAQHQQMLYLPAMLAPAVLPTTDLLQCGSRPEECAADSSASQRQQQQQKQQQHRLQDPQSSVAAEPVEMHPTACFEKVLVSAVLTAAAASSPKRRRPSSRPRGPETPICPAAAPITTPVSSRAAPITPNEGLMVDGLQHAPTATEHTVEAAGHAVSRQQELQVPANNPAPTAKVAPPPTEQAHSPSAAAAAQSSVAAVAAVDPGSAEKPSIAGTAVAPAAAPARAAAVEFEQDEVPDGSHVLQLSPSELLVEVPVCISEVQGPPMPEVLLQEALTLTQHALANPAAAAAAAAAECSNAAADGCWHGGLNWDASWGHVCPALAGLPAGTCSSPAAAAAVGSKSADSPWWASQAVQDLLLGQCPANVASHLTGQVHSKVASASTEEGPRPINLGSSAGSLLLESMLAADLQQDSSSSSSSLLLPVALFPDDARLMGPGSSSSSEPDLIQQLISSCGCRKQPTAHLELYMDWSWLQPLPTATAVAPAALAGTTIAVQVPAAGAAAAAAVGTKRVREAVDEPTVENALAAAAAGKRVRRSLASAQADSQPHTTAAAAAAPVAFDVLAWISIIAQQTGLRQLQSFQDLVQQPGAAAMSPDPTAPLQKQLNTFWCIEALKECVLQTTQQQIAAEEPQAAWGESNAAAGAAEVQAGIPQAVAAAVAAWKSAQSAEQAAATAKEAAVAQQGSEGSMPTTGSAQAQAAGSRATATAAAAAAVTDMDFFLQLQTLAAADKAGSKAAKRQLPAQQQQPQQQETTVAQQAASTAAKTRVPSLSVTAADGAAADVGSRKRPRIEGLQVSTAAEPAQQQQQDGLTDQALTGIHEQPSGRPAAVAEEACQQLVVLQPPTIIHVDLPLPLLQIMLSLQANRKAVLASMQGPDTLLLSCKLWDDSAVQKAIASFQQNGLPQSTVVETGAAAVQQQKQHARKLGSLLVLAQAASCLLHYGVRVAHLFLQHSLQKLPSVAAACAAAAAALAKTYEAVEKLAVTGAGGRGAAANGSSYKVCKGGVRMLEDHPKHGKLQELLMQLTSTKPGCKLLLVAETKGFFSIYQAISAAGLSAVQLDRSRRLLQHGPSTAAAAAAVDTSSDATAAAAKADAEAWHVAAQTALKSGDCVLVTHEHLLHPSMPVDLFDLLVEYIAQEDTTGKVGGSSSSKFSSSSSSSARRDDVAAKFSGFHYVLKMVMLDLRAAAADVAAADSGKPAATSTASPDPKGPTTAAAAAVANPSLAAAVPRPAAAAGAEPAEVLQVAINQADHVAAATLTANAAAAAEASKAAEYQATAEHRSAEYPLVLNRSPGSLLRQCKTLYESLLQLEQQGHILVERHLGCNLPPAATAAAAAADNARRAASSGTAAAAVDVVLSPAACLAVWGEANLPQEAAAVMPFLSQSLLQLSLSYEAVYYIMELPEQLLQLVVKQLPGLQLVAAAAGIKLQVLCSFSAANTQDYILALCRSLSASFWTSSSSSSSSGVQLSPPSISDIPTAQEALLSSCLSLNPLSAAILASKGVSLRTIFDTLAAGRSEQADEQTTQMLSHLSVGIPKHSMQLLAAQVTACHLELEGDSPQLPNSSTAKRKKRGQQLLVQEEQLGAAQQPHLQQAASSIPTWQQQQQQKVSLQTLGIEMGGQEVEPGHDGAIVGGDGSADVVYDDQPVCGLGPGQDQQQYEQQMAYEALGQQQYTGATDLFDYPLHDNSMTGYENHAAHLRQEQQQQQQYLGGLPMEIDPAGVLDAFLHSRNQQGAGAATWAWPAQQQQEYGQQQSKIAQQRPSMPRQQHSRAHMQPAHQQQRQSHDHLHASCAAHGLLGVPIPFADDLDMLMDVDHADAYQVQQQQRQQQQQQQAQAWQPDAYVPQQRLGSSHHGRQSINTGWENDLNDDGTYYDRTATAAAAGEDGDQLFAAAYDDMGVGSGRKLHSDRMHYHGLDSGSRLGAMFNPTAAAAAAAAAGVAGADAARGLFATGRRPPSDISGGPPDRLKPLPTKRPGGGMFSSTNMTNTASDWAPSSAAAARRGASNSLFSAGGLGRSAAGQQQLASVGRYASAAMSMQDADSDTVGFMNMGVGTSKVELGWGPALDAGLGGEGAAAGEGLRMGAMGLPRGLGRSSSGTKPRGLSGNGDAGRGIGTLPRPRPAASDTTGRSSLLVEAFMPHRNPMKQLKYKKGVGGAPKGKGKQQSKLFWG